MTALLGTVSGLKYKVKHEKLLFRSGNVFFLFVWGGAELGLRVFEKTLKRILNRRILSAQVKVMAYINDSWHKKIFK